MSARNDILSAIRARNLLETPLDTAYRPPQWPGDLMRRFSEMATRAAADVHVLGHEDEIPQAVATILRARNHAAAIHIPGNSILAGLNWNGAQGLSIVHIPPGPDDAAIAYASFGVAETGTLAYPASTLEPASWHFRPGLEIAVLHAGNIVPAMEDALARIKQTGLTPTLNFVTGPSRTADIEQTLELGAHGPKALVILLVGG